MAAKSEWNIPNYELEKLTHYFLELIHKRHNRTNNPLDIEQISRGLLMSRSYHFDIFYII